MNNKNWKLSKIHFIHSTAFISYVSWMKFSVVYKCILAYVCTFTCMCECVCKCLFTITSVSISKCISVLKCGECAVQPTQQLLRIQTKWERIREKQKLFISYTEWAITRTVQQQQNKNTTRSNAKNSIRFTQYNGTAMAYRTYGCLISMLVHTFFLASSEKSNDERGTKEKHHTHINSFSLSFSHYFNSQE